ncbi:MAG: DUF6273 domain-containing protein [Faecousia sp.]
MRKIISLLLALCLLCGHGVAFAEDWTCAVCGSAASGNFCANCGSQRPDDGAWICSSCGKENSSGNFCPNCGQPRGGGALPTFPQQTLQVGDIVTMGTYEQDNLSFNGKEPIEWTVLAVYDGKALMMSRFALEQKYFHKERVTPFSSGYSSFGWKDSSLRAWLNDEFYSGAFSEAEKSRIVAYATEDCEDNVFLLSTSEVKSLPAELVYDDAPSTEYAKANSTRDWSGSYWLRTICAASNGKNADFEFTFSDGSVYSPSQNLLSYTYHAALVREGKLDETGGEVQLFAYGVRPCIWIEI